MIKRFFVNKTSGHGHGVASPAQTGRPPSPPHHIYPGYVDGNSGALPSPYQQPPQNGANGHLAPWGSYLNPNDVTAGNGGSGAGSINDSRSHTGPYLNSGPESSVNGDDVSNYGSPVSTGASSVSAAGLNNVPLPPAAPRSPRPSTEPVHRPSSPVSSAPTKDHHRHSPHWNRLSRRPKSTIQHPARQPDPLGQLPAGRPAQQSPSSRPPVAVKVSAEDIRDTTYMLRQLYKMELQIYGERYAIHPDDRMRREEMRRKFNLLREEIEDVVNTWGKTTLAGWTPQELKHVEWSIDVIDKLRTMGMDAED